MIKVKALHHKDKTALSDAKLHTGKQKKLNFANEAIITYNIRYFKTIQKLTLQR